MKQGNGFTLLEVTLAMALLATLTLFIAQTTNKAVDAKRKVRDKLDRIVELRDSISLMSRDIGLAFNYRDINAALLEAANKIPTPTPTAPTPSPTPTPVKEEELIVTHFIGEQDALHFSALSNIRTEEDQKSSDQSEISYFLKSCKSRRDNKKSSTCLWRRISPFIDDDIKSGGQSRVILENVSKLQFRYLGPGHTEEWIRTWATDGSKEQDMKNNFPYAVEISLEIEDTKSKTPKKLAMTAVAQIHFPNNETKKKEPDAGTPAPTPPI